MRLNDVEIMQLTECYENRLLEPWRGFSQMKCRSPLPRAPKPATCGTADITAPDGRLKKCYHRLLKFF